MRLNIKHSLVVFVLLSAYYLLHTTDASAQQASLAFSPATGTFNKGCSYPIKVLLNTGGAQTDGTDAIIIYDTSVFSATSINQGSIYPQYPGNSIDDAGGKVTLSGLASITQPYAGQGTLGTVNFTVKDNAPAGAAQIRFSFDPNDKTNTTDSNIADHNSTSDVLSSVVNGSYVVGTGACTTNGGTPGSVVQTGLSGPQGATLPTTASGGLIDQQKKTLDQYVGGKTGSEQLTYTVAIFGVTLTLLGIIGLAIL